jgi:hypothetical protein
MSSLNEKLNKIEIDIYSNPLYFGLLMLIEFIIFLVIVYKFNPYYDPNKPNDYEALTQFIVLIVGFLYVILFMFLKEKLIKNVNILSLDIETPTENSFLGRTIATLLFFIIFVLLTISIVWIFSNLSFITSIISNGLILLLIISIIAVIYIVLKKSVDKLFPQNGFLSFIKNFILFIPCLLIRLAEYIKYEYKITGKPVWILLIIEIILILLWVIIPILFKYYFDKDGSKLLDGPVYLNKRHDIGKFENLHQKNLEDKKDSKFLYHYSLSAWFNINPQPPNTSTAYTKYTSILNYGNKPNVQYNGEKNSLRVITALDDKNGEKLNEVVIFETKNILYQKWNNIVINYDGGDMDVFLNGELVGSKPGIAPYMRYENVSVGEMNGIQGGMCNVKYYNHILSKKDIKLTYKMLRDKNIPNV